MSSQRSGAGGGGRTGLASATGGGPGGEASWPGVSAALRSNQDSMGNLASRSPGGGWVFSLSAGGDPVFAKPPRFRRLPRRRGRKRGVANHRGTEGTEEDTEGRQRGKGEQVGRFAFASPALVLCVAPCPLCLCG